MARALRALLRGLSALVLLGGLVAGSAIAHAQLGVGRAAVRDRIVKVLDGQIEGSTTIGAVSSFWPGPLGIRDVVVRDPKGRLVLRVDRADLWLRPAPFLSGGDIAVRRARVEGGEVRLVETPSGKLTIELAFDGAGRSPDRRRVTMEKVRFAGLRAVIDAENVPTVVLDEGEGLARLERTPDRRFELRIDRATADWTKPTPAGADVEIARLEGWVSSKARQTFEVSTLGEVNGGRFALELRYFPRRTPGMQLHYRAFDREPATLLAAVGLSVVERRSENVETIVERPGSER